MREHKEDDLFGGEPEMLATVMKVVWVLVSCCCKKGELRVLLQAVEREACLSDAQIMSRREDMIQAIEKAALHMEQSGLKSEWLAKVDLGVLVRAGPWGAYVACLKR